MEDDENEVVQAPPVTAAEIAREVAALTQPQQQYQAPQVFDAIAASAQRLKDEGYPDEYIKGVLMGTQATRIEFDQKLSLLENRVNGNQHYTRVQEQAKEVINRVLKPYAKEEAIVRKSDMAIRAEIEEKFKSNPSLIAKWNRGVIDETALEELTEGVVEDFLKAAGKGGNSGAKSVSPIKTGANAPSMPSKKVDSEEDLDDNQNEFYQSYVTAMNTYSREKPEEIKAKALARAATVIQPILRKSVR